MTHNTEEIDQLRGLLDTSKQQTERDRATIETLRSEAEEHQGEALRHFRNALAVVRSIVNRTVADGEMAEDYQARLSSRLASFARLESHLLRNPATGVDLCLLIADELLPFGIRLGSEVRVEGEDIFLEPKAASVLGGAFHELARMTVEGGGFGDFEAGSQIVVHCIIETDDNADPSLRIDWKEKGRGTGSSSNAEVEFDRDVEGAVAYDLAGTVRLEVTSDGLHCQFRLPANRVVRSSKNIGE